MAAFLDCLAGCKIGWWPSKQGHSNFTISFIWSWSKRYWLTYSSKVGDLSTASCHVGNQIEKAYQGSRGAVPAKRTSSWRCRACQRSSVFGRNRRHGPETETRLALRCCSGRKSEDYCDCWQRREFFIDFFALLSWLALLCTCQMLPSHRALHSRFLMQSPALVSGTPKCA